MIETIGARTYNLRRSAENNETQQGLADAIGVSRELVKAWERGSRKIQIDDLVKLAKHFDVSTDYLLGLSLQTNKITPNLRAAVAMNTIRECLDTFAKCWEEYMRDD